MADFTTPMGAGAYIQLSMQQNSNPFYVNWQFYLVCGNGQSFELDPVPWGVAAGGNNYGGGYTFDFRHETVHLIAAGTTFVGRALSVFGSATTANTGTSIGGPATVQGTIGLVQAPGAAQALYATSIKGTTVTLHLDGVTDNGNATTHYTVQYSKDGGPWTGDVNGDSGTIVYSNLQPGSYRFAVTPWNAVGVGPVTYSPTYAVYGGGKIKVNGAMRPLTVHLKTGGLMRPVTARVKVNGVMRPLG